MELPPKDKLLHLLAGIGICLIIGIYSPIYGLLAGTLAGIGKEVYDKVSKKGCVDIYDAIYTILGSVLVYTCYILRGML